MSQFLEVFIPIIVSIVTAILGWIGVKVDQFINAKIKDKKMAAHASAVNLIVINAVQCVFQTFVDTIKKAGKFDEKAQNEAKERAMVIIESQLTTELKEYITTNFGDIKAYLMNKIESVIYTLKK